MPPVKINQFILKNDLITKPIFNNKYEIQINHRIMIGREKKNYNEISPDTGQNGHHQDPTDYKCWRGCGEKGILLLCWWECKLIQPLWKMVWRFLQKLGIKPPCYAMLC